MIKYKKTGHKASNILKYILGHLMSPTILLYITHCKITLIFMQQYFASITQSATFQDLILFGTFLLTLLAYLDRKNKRKKINSPSHLIRRR